MLYKDSMTEPPPLFVQLDKLEKNENQEYLYWKEKARWIRFEEQAEDALGRWSKPYVATIPQSALDELKQLIINGRVCLSVNASDIKEIADVLANELLDYFNDYDSARIFAEIVCLPHHHHHEKRVRKTASGNNLMRMVSSANFQDFKREENVIDENNVSQNEQISNPMRRRMSFVDNVTLDESVAPDFKENTKFRKKVHRKAEGASILVMPVEFVTKTQLVFIRLEAATELQGLLEVRLRSRFVVLLIGPAERHVHLYEIGRALAACLADDLCRELFYAAKTKENCVETIDRFNRCTLVIPPSEWNPKIRIEPPEKYLSKEERKNVEEISEFIHGDDDFLNDHDHVDPSLKGSRRPFRGISEDIRRKLPFYLSDFTDGLNLQCVASTMYVYLVTLCSLVAFGGMLGEKTNKLMATMECILAGSVCGVAFSLFAGQPLNIISATGPMLILEGIIKTLCDKNGIDYMEFRLWIGLWTALLIVVFVAFNLSFLVKYITRFTEDSFATLVAVIFIFDAIKSTLKLKQLPKEFLDKIANETHLNRTFNESPTQLQIAIHEKNYFFSILLFLLTFFVCITLKQFRTKPFLPSKIREIFSDFAVMIAIVLASLLDKYMGFETQKLTIPSKFQPTTAERGWIIPLFGKNPFYTIFIAIIPALIATILVFMDQQITGVIVNRKEFKLKKSSGYHLDLFIVGVGIALCSILGLPWFVAATVLALAHVDSLRLMSENAAPGERPIFMGVREQRATTFVMSILIGLSVFLNSILSNIPMAVLYGVFMFMGVSALNGMQFIQRLLIIFMPAKHQPDLPYLRHVSLGKVHLFTIIQLLSLVLLYLIKNIESVAITFPILVLATCLIRKLLDFVFTQRELFWLDDLLPGGKKNNDNSSNPEKQKLTGGKVDLSADSFFKNESEKSISIRPVTKSHEKEMKDLFSSTNSNLDYDTDSNEPSVTIRFSDSLDENNNNNNSFNVNSTKNNHHHHHPPPVKFVTHFSEIKEDED
ncbi:unnamed protein product [Brachionus calyciflorus]|uniref:Anion exchange protein n=1 Tax=Brachionus calyciflorus TaxID=104777 RepID=A0A813UJ62_9BILA|nr:unnamed protein product [Brachionus calyciflorus]